MERIVKNQLVYWFPVYVWAVLIFYLSSITPAGVSTEAVFVAVSDYSDYYYHVLEYGFFTFLLWRAFHNSKFKHSGILAIVIAFVYSISDELHQYFVPGRHSSLFDVFLNFIGIVLVQPIIILYKNLKK